MVRGLIIIAALAFLMPDSVLADAVSQRLIGKAERAIAQKAYRDVIRFCEQAIVADPADPSAFACLGQGHMRSGDKKAAERYYKIALEILPTHERALSWSGEIDIADGRPDIARKKLNRLRRACGDCSAYKRLRAALLRYESKKSSSKKSDKP